MADQQFCLRWNNHQSTLVSVFDSLLERGAMVDCTLAAEGQCLQAHKVVLSACSPYLETLLSQHYDKHPILLLKDIKFYELQAMMDYMYRGEVNVAQDKLGMFLKAAESLQIKGLSESGGNEPADSGGTGTVTKRTTKSAPVTNVPRTSSLPVERRRPAPPQVVDVASDASRDGSVSPSLRKRRRRVSASEETSASAANSTDGHDAAASNSVAAGGAEITPAVPINGSTDNNALGILSSLMDGSVENDNLRESGPSLNTSTTQSSDRVREKVEPTSEVMIEPKAEYLDADEDVEDLTLDDNMDDSGMSNAGPSQRQGQGYQWHMGDQSTDEVFMAAQEAVGANRDAQGLKVRRRSEYGDENTGIPPLLGWPSLETEYEENSTSTRKRRPHSRGNYPCKRCGRTYVRKDSLTRHMQWECGKEPQFQCPFCPQKCKRRTHQIRHIQRQHKQMMDDLSDKEKAELQIA